MLTKKKLAKQTMMATTKGPRKAPLKRTDKPNLNPPAKSEEGDILVKVITQSSNADCDLNAIATLLKDTPVSVGRYDVPAIKGTRGAICSKAWVCDGSIFANLIFCDAKYMECVRNKGMYLLVDKDIIEKRVNGKCEDRLIDIKSARIYYSEYLWGL